MSKKILLAAAIAAGVGVFLCASPRVLADGDEEERKLIDEMYGKKIVAVQGTSADDDDIDLAKQMLVGANDTTNTKTLRFLLAQKSLLLTLPIGTDESGALAMKAMELADGLGALTKLEKATYVRQMTAMMLNRARNADKKAPEYLAALARAAVEANLQYCRLVIDDETKGPDVTTALADARSYIVVYKLSDMMSAFDELDKQARANSSKRNTMKDVMAKLDAAKKAGEPDGIKQASRAVALAYLEFDSDIPTAARYLDGTDDPRAKGLSAAAAFMDNPQAIDVATIPDTIDAIQTAAAKLPDIPKGNLALIGMKMAQVYLDSKPSDISATKVKLQIIQLKALTAGLLGDKLRKQLIANYGSMGAKVEVLDEERARLTYDFTSAAQMADWDKPEAGWEIAGGSLGYQGNAMGASSTIRNKIVFRRDKPIKISFNCTATYRFGLLLTTASQPISSSSAMYVYESSERFYLDTGGAHYSGMAESFSDPKTRLDPRKDNKFEAACDAKGVWTFTLNGQLVKEVSPREMGRPAADTFRCALLTDSMQKSRTVFDNLVIEGTVVVDPKTTKQPDDKTPIIGRRTLTSRPN